MTTNEQLRVFWIAEICWAGPQHYFLWSAWRRHYQHCGKQTHPNKSAAGIVVGHANMHQQPPELLNVATLGRDSWHVVRWLTNLDRAVESRWHWFSWCMRDFVNKTWFNMHDHGRSPIKTNSSRCRDVSNICTIDLPNFFNFNICSTT